jgi:hypothetical protein
MAKELYCWRCRTEMPMLDESEWARIAPYLQAAVRDPAAWQAALDLYETMTGLRETNINAIFHHRMSDYGPPCLSCRKPLRTPKARFCAACGAAREISSSEEGEER